MHRPLPELRPFQQAVVAKARDANVVMVGATGIGKTFVAIALLCEQDYSAGQRAFVLAPTRQLVWQITTKIRAATALHASALCGDTATAQWGAREWAHALAATRVVVTTPDVLRDALERGLVRLAQLNLLVVDECHHAARRHPYAHVFKVYNATPERKRPRVFGTTATPTRDCARRLDAELVRVELDALETATFAAAAPLQWEPYDKEPRGTRPPTSDSDGYRDEELDQLYELLTELDAPEVLRELLRQGTRDNTRHDALVRKFVVTCVDVLRGLGVWCVYRFIELELERAARSVSPLLSVPGSLYGLDRTAVKAILLARRRRHECAFATSKRLAKLVSLLEQHMPEWNSVSIGVDEAVGDKDQDELLVCEPPLEEHKDDCDDDHDTSYKMELTNDETKPMHHQQGIVFVSTRAECRVVCEYLNERLAASEAVDVDSDDTDDEGDDGGSVGSHEDDPRVACLLGQAALRDAAAFGLPPMDETLAKFERGAIQCIVSTAVSAEGIDFPQCALVIVASRVDAARQLMQLRGRARHADGVVYYLGEAGDHGHALHVRTLLDEADAIATLDFRHDKPETPCQQPRALLSPPDPSSRLLVASTGAVLDLDSSVARLYAFCQTLPSQLCPPETLRGLVTFEQKTVHRRPLFRARVELPAVLALALAESHDGNGADQPPLAFESAFVHSKATAKAMAALAACQFLHARGLLDDALRSVFCRRKSAVDLTALLHALDR